MFTLSGFTAFYFSLAALIALLIWYEKPLLELEKKHDQKRKKRK